MFDSNPRYTPTLMDSLGDALAGPMLALTIGLFGVFLWAFFKGACILVEVAAKVLGAAFLGLYRLVRAGGRLAGRGIRALMA